jgi:O-methyltransferase involved in polyketide biosynthesis
VHHAADEPSAFPVVTRAVPATMLSVSRAPSAGAPPGFDALASTLLIPLAARAHADALFPALAARDAHAVRLLDALGADVSPYLADTHSMYGVLSRTRQMRRAGEAFFAAHPSATGAALGAGLSHYHQWLDNGRNHWIDIDRPAVTALREQLLPAQPRRRNVAADLAAPGWWTAAGLPQRRRGPPLLLLAEGLLMYLEAAQVQHLLATFGEHAPPGSLLLADCFSRLMVGLEALHPSVRHTAARFRWGVGELAELTRAHARLELRDEQPVMDGMGLPERIVAQGLRLCTGVPFYSVYTLGLRRDAGDSAR